MLTVKKLLCDSIQFLYCFIIGVPILLLMLVVKDED